MSHYTYFTTEDCLSSEETLEKYQIGYVALEKAGLNPRKVAYYL